jgi:hypothetical protein
MKSLNLFGKITAGILIVGSLISAGLDGALEAKMNTIKEECRDAISDTRYEGSKLTYFSSGAKQVKSVELFLFNNSVYIFAVSGKATMDGLTLKVYDAAADVKERKLIKEIKKLNGHTTTFSSTELNQAYAKQVKGVDRLKNVYLEYHIAAGKSGNQGIVLVYGSKR